MKNQNYIITLPKLFSCFALGNDSFYVVAFVKYKSYKILSCIILSVGYGLASRRYYLFDKKLPDSCVSENTQMFLTCQIKSCYSQQESLEKKGFEKQQSFIVI